MLGTRSVLAVVPARGGSKGIPLKNLREIAGRSLVAHVGEVVRGVPEIDRAVVSTDHPRIVAAAEAAGLAAPFLRPPELSGDRIGDLEVLAHALQATEAADRRRYDVVVMLQPTSPLRTPAQVSATLRMLDAGDWDSVWTVSETDLKSHPLKQLTLGADGALGYFDPRGAAIIARQQLTPVYHRNGVAYAITRACLLDQGSIMGRKAGALLIEGNHVSIDTEDDLARVERLLSQRNAEAVS
jgi:CMP-N,N'-diacetyllegionaminic acid synthase